MKVRYRWLQAPATTDKPTPRLTMARALACPRPRLAELQYPGEVAIQLHLETALGLQGQRDLLDLAADARHRGWVAGSASASSSPATVFRYCPDSVPIAGAARCLLGAGGIALCLSAVLSGDRRRRRQG